MTLTPEQFNKLATKEDLENFITKDYFDKKFDKLLTLIDGVMKDYKDHKIEHISNQAAHDRFEGRITKIEKTIKIAEKA